MDEEAPTCHFDLSPNINTDNRIYYVFYNWVENVHIRTTSITYKEQMENLEHFRFLFSVYKGYARRLRWDENNVITARQFLKDIKN